MPDDQIRLLALDGGGVRGLSSLLILQQLMATVDSESPPKPCDFFDMIGGTSTGGLIAIMLGRLQMTIVDCIEAYTLLSDKVFEKKAHRVNIKGKLQGRFDTTALEEAIKQILKERGINEDLLLKDSPDTSCKVFVCATSKETSGTVCLTSYRSPRGGIHLLDSTKIWQACRATSAATTFFDPIAIGPFNEEFVDGALGTNNPIHFLWSQAQDIWGADQLQAKLSCLVSIGTGVPALKPVRDDVLGIWSTLKDLTTETERTAEQFIRDNSSLDDEGRYYRFNVDRGLEDIGLEESKKKNEIAAATGRYIGSQAVFKQMKACASSLTRGYGPDGREEFLVPYISNSDLVGSSAILRQLMDQVGHRQPRTSEWSQPRVSLYGPGGVGETLSRPGRAPTNDNADPVHFYIPFPKNKRFVERGTILDTLEQMLFVQKERKVALVGLGGIGKTQVALQFAYRTKDQQPTYSIFWVPALSNGSFEQAYMEITKRLAIRKSAEDEDPRESVRRYLSSTSAGPWLLIVDNADDMEILFGSPTEPGGISEYLPESEQGLVLFTTRSREVAVAMAGNYVVELHEMGPEEGIDFLKRSLIRKDLVDDEAAATKLLVKLTHLPLAITQAAAYLNRNPVSVAEYLELLQGTEQNMVSLMSREFHDSTRYKGSPNAVATTWLISFDQIRKTDSTAADLLAFISRIEPKTIPQSILPSCESEEQTMHTIGTLCTYTFLGRRGESKVYDMHSLVHLAARIWVQKHGFAWSVVKKAIHHLVDVFPSDDYANRSLWREYLPHALKVLQEKEGLDIEERYELYFRVGRCLQADGRTKEAVMCHGECHQWRKAHLPEDHPSRLASQHELARSYQDDGQVKRALQLLEHIVETKGRTLAEDHPDRLASQHELARSYQADGQVKRALQLLEHIVETEGRTLAEDHPDRLASQHELAIAYQDDGQVKRALQLMGYVVAVRERTLAADHPHRLASQEWLAYIYTL